MEIDHHQETTIVEHEQNVISAHVRDLIFSYERQMSTVAEPLETAASSPPPPFYHHESDRHRRRTKSIGSKSYKLFRDPHLDLVSLVDIEKELVRIETHLNYYEYYEKETHVAFQEQLFAVLTGIVGVESHGLEDTVRKQRQLIAETQKLAKLLNSKLPYDNGSTVYQQQQQQYRNASPFKKTHHVDTTTTKRGGGGGGGEEAIVSTSSYREHVEESVSSTKESTISQQQQQQQQQQQEVVTTPVANREKPSSSSSTVSKLKKFFSMRRADQSSDVKVIPAAYSGVGRSQSLYSKTYKYATTTKKRSGNETTIKINGNGGDVSAASSPARAVEEQSAVEISLYGEGNSVDRFEESKEEVNEVQQNVSVSKLKSLFEESKKENDEGNYLNFTGLLKNVDIRRKADLSKSKSTSDLKYAIKEGYVSGELDGDDDNYDEVSIDLKNDTNNNDTKIGKKESFDRSRHLINSSSIVTVEEKQATQTTESTFSSSVRDLKKSFEHNEDIEHVLHRHIEPVPKRDGDLGSEPVLKIPIQLRTGFLNVNHNEEDQSESRETVESDFNNSSTLKPDALAEQIIDKEEINVTAGTVESLKRAFESTTGTTTGETVVNKTSIESTPVQSRVEETLYEAILEPPADFNKTQEEIVSSQSVEVLKETFENLQHNGSEHRVASSEFVLREEAPFQTAIVSESQRQEAVRLIENEPNAKRSIQLQINGEAALYDHVMGDQSQTGSISVSSRTVRAEESSSSSSTIRRAVLVEDRSENSSIKVLDSPSSFATLLAGTRSSSNSKSQVASSGSVSYAEKKIVQQQHSHVSSQKISSSFSASADKTDNYLRIENEAYSYPPSSFLPTNNDDEDSVKIEEIETRPLEEEVKYNLNVSKENILEEILNDSDEINVNEEFEKILQET